MLDALLSGINSLQNSLKRGTAVNVNDRAAKLQALDVAKLYFEDVRPRLVLALGETDVVLVSDELWHELVALAHGNNSRDRYLRILKEIARTVKTLNVTLLVASTRKLPTAEISLSAEEELLITTLESVVPSAAASYRQTCRDLKDNGRLSYRGTASEFREALRETVDHLAPDDAVKKTPNFKLEKDQTGPTMKQKVKFILSERERNRAQIDTNLKVVDLLEELTGAVTRAVYTEASVATHVQKSIKDVKRLKRQVDNVLYDILEIPT